MAPAKRKTDEQQPTTNTNTTASSRITRSSTRAVNAGVAAAIKKPPVRSPKVSKKNKKAKISPNVKPEKEEEEEEEQVEATKAVEGSKTIVIEHCKQCNQFKKRAFQVQDGLKRGVSGITVLINPEKPRRGCFEIREEGGEKFISLLDMKRPFAPMRALDMDSVISDIINKIK